MAEIKMNPADLEGDTEEQLQAAADFYIHLGLLKPGDRFVADASAPRVDDADDKVAARNDCENLCSVAYETAKKACNLTPSYSKCRKKAKKAYQICVAACGLQP